MPVHNLRVARVIQGVNGGIAWIVICLVFIITVPFFRSIRARLTRGNDVGTRSTPIDPKE
jgi:hypothetical protein